jgi:Transposase domain (DUF772)
VTGVFRVAVTLLIKPPGENDHMLGRSDRQGDLFDDVVRFCEESLPENSIYGFLARERDGLFPDELFADLFVERGRRSVPPSVVATVMVLQRLEGLSDREAVDRYAFDVHWRYAAGAGVRSPRLGRKPATWTRIDRDYEQIRIDMHSLFHDLGINPAALAA